MRAHQREGKCFQPEDVAAKCWISYVHRGVGFHMLLCLLRKQWDLAFIHHSVLQNITHETLKTKLSLKIYRSVQSSTDCLCNTNLQADFH